MRNKIIYLILVAILITTNFSCTENLDVAPQNIIQDETVFSNESAINAYFASLYYSLPIEDFRFHVYGGFNSDGGSTLPIFTDEATICSNDDRQDIGGGTSLGWWGYNDVRNVNQFIDKISSSAFAKEKVDQWLGEAKFIRAYYYFGMVKRYGGVPLITSVQNYTGDNLDELKVPRNTEKEIYDFIAKELDESAALLGETSSVGRVNKYVVYALKSRAMLYAATEAKYSSVQLNGLVGIQASSADAYFQSAYEAAQRVISSGKYSLYNKNDDKSANYTSLFLDDASPENIFIKQFSYPDKAHSYDLWMLPRDGVGSSIGYGSRLNPTLELVESYEYKDGTDGKLKFSVGGNPVEYKNYSDIFLNKDPRLDATVILPFSTWKGYTLDVRAGIKDNGQTITSGDYNTLHNGMHVIGFNGIGGGGEKSQTGFYARKYLQPAYDRTKVANFTSAQSFIDFRYAEILLNYAEAAIELGKKSDAKTAVNLVRDRAGIKKLDDADVTLDRVRHERRIELALEPHRYWDIRRWHIADKLLNNTKFSAILPYYVVSTNSYIFETKSVSYQRTFTPNMYYEMIPSSEISKNPTLIQNPGY